METAPYLMNAADYLSRAGLPHDCVTLDRLERIQADLESLAESHPSALTADALASLYQYRVPRLSDDGSCSLGGELEPLPFDLTDWLGGLTESHHITLWRLHRLLDRVVSMTGIDWLGLYQARRRSGARKLVKLAYRGAPSRAVFPLTEEFAARSNNCAVCHSGRARLIPDIEAYQAGGGGYYECDARVRSEVCLPLYGEFGDILGILDAEAFLTDFFDPSRLACFIAMAIVSPRLLPA